MDDEIYLTDLFAPVMAKWKLVLVFALIGAVVCFVMARRSPRAYESTATIFVQQNSTLSGLRASLPIPLGPLGANSLGYYVTLLESETLTRKTIARLALLQEPAFTGGKRISLRQAVRRLKGCTTIKDGKDGTVDISVASPDPNLAARIANGTLDSLSDAVVTKSRRTVDFVERKLAETTIALQQAEDRLFEFEKRTGVPAIEEQTKQVINQLGEVDSQLLALDIELKATQSELGNTGDLETLVQNEIRKKGIESSRNYVLTRKDELMAVLGKLPDVASQYVKLDRDVMVLSKTFELLTERYQLARIEQQGEGGDYQLIDRARPADMPLSRGTVRKTFLGALAGFAVGSVVAMAGAHARQRRKARK